MATTAARLLQNGTYQAAGKFDEVTYTYAPNGSVQFANASLNYLSVPANAAFTLNTFNHTIEFWAYQTSRGLYDTAWNYASTASARATNNYYFNMGSSQFMVIVGNGSNFLTTTNITGANLPSLNAWHHYAIVRNANTITLYIDGVAQAGAINISSSSITAQTGLMLIGGNGSTNQTINGYISNFRFVKIDAVYTSNFTPPTAPLMPITNTQLLLNTTNDANYLKDSSSNNFTVTNSNSAVSSSLAPFAGGIGFPNKITASTIFTAQLDEVTLKGSGVAKRETNDGRLLVSGQFDEISLANVITPLAGMIFDLDAANFSAVPANGALDATATYALTVANAGSTIGWSSSNGGIFTKSATTATDSIIGGPNTTSQSYTVFMAYQPQAIASGGQGRILSCNTGQDWLIGTYAPAPGSGTMYMNVFYPGSEVWLSHDTADTGWHFIWTTYNISTGIANLYIASNGANNTVGPTAYYKSVTFAANSNRGFNQFTMWRRPGPSEAGRANIGFIKAYNRDLSVSEIQTLWSQYHSRFGI